MADIGIYTTNAQIQAKAGLGASAVSKAVAWTDVIVLMVENFINVECRKVFAVDAAAFTALPASTKYLLSDVASSLAAIYVINYDFAGYPTRIVAEDMINILRDSALRGIQTLKEEKTTEFVLTGAR